MNQKFIAQIPTVMATLIIMTLIGCGYLVQPRVVADLQQYHKGRYQLDQTHAAVIIKISHMGLSTFVGRFKQVDASLDFDPKNIVAARLSAVIDIGSLDINNRELAETLMGPSWFNQQKYPQAFFTTTQVLLVDNNSAQFTGNLTLKGVTKPIVIKVHFNGAANNFLTGFYTLGFSASSAFKRSDFGMDTLIPAIADQVDIEVFAEFQQRDN
jgi:polyisoprenoid-binding protein YceI